MSYSLFTMPQVLKPEKRERMLEAAERVFAREGFEGATMATIAREAGISTGNLYRYFAGKEALFEAMLSADFVARFEALLDERVGALAGVDLRALPEEARAADEELLRFWIEHRLRVVVLLDRSAGSAHADFGERFVARLVELAYAQLAEEAGCALPAPTRLTLTNAFHHSRRAVVAILETQDDEDALREAFAAFRSFQLAGLEGLKRWVLA